jgi:hypothetical protein
MGFGVADEVGDHPHQASLVGLDDAVDGVGAHGEGNIGVGGGGHGVEDKLADPDLFQVESCRSGVEAGDLEQVLHHGRKAGDVGHEEVEGGPCPFGHVGPLPLQHSDRRGQGGQRGPQLVAHVRGKAGVSLDAFLEGAGHVVERGHQRAEVGVVDVGHPGVEATSGDSHGGGTHVGQRS